MFIVRHNDVLPLGSLEGHGISFDSCQTCCRNVCQADLKAESEILASQQNTVYRSLCSWADSWGKAAVNRAELLVMFQGTSGGEIMRFFALVISGNFNPKFQTWCRVAVVLEHKARVCADPLQLPFEVEIVGSPSLVCPELTRVDAISGE
jgi:hypothetical protein